MPHTAPLHRRITSVVAVLGLVVGVIAVGPTSPAFALTNLNLVVDSPDDFGDASPGDGSCDDGTGSCTLRAAFEEHSATNDTGTTTVTVPGWRIVLDDTLYAAPAVSRELVLQGVGMGATILDGDDATFSPAGGFAIPSPATARRVIEVAEGSLTLNDLTVTGGASQNQLNLAGTVNFGGGGLLVDFPGDNLTLSNTEFTSNVSTLSGGGLEYWGTGAVQITGSAFYGNTTNSLGGGAAINVNASSVLIEDTDFERNGLRPGSAIEPPASFVPRQGGGLYLNDNATLRGLRFTDNTALEGGGLFLASNFVTLSDSDLSGNHAWENGGGVHASDVGGTLSVSTTEFVSNGAFDPDGDGGYDDGLGGAISVGAGRLNVTDSGFSLNFARDGGAIARQGAAPTNSINVDTSWFEANTAHRNGGAYAALIDSATFGSSTAIFDSVSLLANAATTGDGGAVYNADSDGAIFRFTTLSDNVAAGTNHLHAVDPGSVTVNLSLADFDGASTDCLNVDSSATKYASLATCSLSSTAADQTFGAPVVEQGPSVAVGNGQMGRFQTVAASTGGAVVSGPSCNGDDQRGAARLQSGTTCDHGAIQSGFLVNEDGDLPDLTPGDGLCDTDNGTVGEQCSLRAAVTEGNLLTGTAAIDVIPLNNPWVPDVNAVLTVTQDTILVERPAADNSRTVRVNHAADDSLFEVAAGVSLDVNGLWLSFGATAANLGTFFRLLNGADLRLMNMEIDGGIATTDGGAIHAAGLNDLVLRDVEMTWNQAGDSGGAIHMTSGSLTLRDSFVGLERGDDPGPNLARLSGGAIHATGSSDLDIRSTIFANNGVGTTDLAAPNNRFGGAISLEGGSVARFGDTSFTDNIAGQGGTSVFGYGAAISNNDGQVTFAPVSRAAVFDSSFTNNDTPAGAAGAIYTVTGISRVRNAFVTGNDAVFGSGAFEVPGSGTISIVGSEVSANTSGAAFGGAVSAGVGGTVILADTFFENNSSTTEGGAVHVAGSVETHLHGLTFKGNVAGDFGGAINANVPIQIRSSTFIDNDGGAAGGAIRLTTNAVGSVIEDSSIGTVANPNLAATGAGISADSAVDIINTDVVGQGNSGALGGNIDLDVPTGETTRIIGGSVTDGTASSGGGIRYTGLGALVIDGTTISDNAVNSVGDEGGGIAVLGADFTMRNATVSRNAAPNGNGGGIFVFTDGENSVLIEDSLFEDNTGDSATGTAIHLEQDSPLTLRRTTITDDPFANGFDVSGSDGPGADGPIVLDEVTFVGDPTNDVRPYMLIIARPFTMLSSTLTGGSVIVNNNSAPATILNSTFELTGIEVYGDLDVVRSTFFGNSGLEPALEVFANAALTVTSSTIVGYTGSAIETTSTVTPIVDRSILEGNSPSECIGTIEVSYTLIGTSGGGCTLTGPQLATNILDDTADLAPILADNGGLTETLLFQSSSAAVDVAPEIGTVATDQRGLFGVVNGLADLGAVEAQVGELAAPSLTVSILADQPVYTPGASIVPSSDISAQEIQSSSLNQTNVLEAPISAIPISAIPISAIPISAIPISAIDLTLPGVQETLAGTPLNEIRLFEPIGQNGQVENIRQLLELSTTGLENRPRQSITLQNVLDDPGTAPVILSAPISAIDFGETPISAIPISAIPISAIPISAIDWVTILDDQTTTDPAEALCNLFAANGFSCGDLGTTPGDATILDAAIAGAPISAIPISAIPISAIPISAIPISAIPISAINLSASPISAIPISAIPISAIEVNGTPISAIPISAIEVEGVPISAIPISAIPISAIPISAIPISAIPISAINVTGSPISAIPISAIPISAINPQSSPISAIPISAIPISAIPISAIPISAIPISAIDAQASPISAIPISAIPISAIDQIIDCNLVDCQNDTLGDAGDAGAILGTATVGLLGDTLSAEGSILSDIIAYVDRQALGVQAALDATVTGDLGTYGTALFDDLLPLTGLDLATTPLQDILPGLPLDIDGLRQLMDAIGSQESQQLLDDLADLGLEDLFDLGGLTILDILPILGATLFADLLQIIHDSPAGDTVSLLDLVLALLPSDQIPWTEIDISRGGIQHAVDGNAATNVVFTIDVTTNGQNATEPFEVRLDLPGGAFVGQDAPAAFSAVGALQPVDLQAQQLGEQVIFTIPPQANGTFSLVVTAAAPLSLGTNTADVAVQHATLGTETDSVEVSVVEEFEPNDTVADAANSPDLEGDVVVLSHIGAPGDVDLFPVTLEPGEAFSAFLGNVPKGTDLDLVLYGPPGTEVPGVTVDDVEGGGETTQVAQDVVLLTDRPAIQISANRGRSTERVDLPPVQFAGEYLVQVTGYNESAAAPPYSLQASVTPAPVLPPCAPWPAGLTTTDATGSAPVTVADASTQTLFLVHRDRYAGAYGQAAVADLDALLAQVAALDGAANDPLVNGHVMVLDEIPTIDTAYDAWDAARCDVNAANVIVEAIRTEIDALRTGVAPNIAHIVVVGPDEQVPFARIPDFTDIANERTFADEQLRRIQGQDVSDELHAALLFGYYLSDNAYADSLAEVALNRPIHIPELAVGRLVEASSEIHGQLQQFLDFDGRLDPATESFVAGYDFLADGAEAVADAVAASGSTVDELISDVWDADEVRARLAGTGSQDIVSANAHYNATSLLSALEDANGTQADLFDANEVVGDYAGTISFTMGCHSALSLSDISVGATPDWAQVWSAHGAQYVGNTGFGYGETETVALSEALMVGFAENLDGSMTIGQALAFAKSSYAADLSSYGVYDEKVLMEATFYGMPNYVIGAPGAPAPVQPEQPLVVDHGLRAVTDVDITPGTTPIVAQTNGDGETYFVVNDGTVDLQPQVTHERPIQPRYDVEVTAHDGTGGVAARATGVIIEALDLVDAVAIDPVISRPIVDQSSEAEEPEFRDGIFPSVFTRVSRYDTPIGPRDRLVVVPGQFRGSRTAGVQTLFRDMDLTVYYAEPGDTDRTQPRIVATKAAVNGTAVGFRVDAGDAAGPLTRVLVLFSEPGSTQWRSVDLAKSGQAGAAERWTGGAALSQTLATGQEVAYFVQVVDGSGNVGVSSAKALFHSAPVLEDIAPPVGGGDDETPATPAASGTQQVGQWFTGPVTVSADGDADGDAVLSVNGQVVQSPITITESGTYEVSVLDEGVTTTSFVLVDVDDPFLRIDTPVNGGIYAQGSTLQVRTTMQDTGSGIDPASATSHPTSSQTAVIGDDSLTLNVSDNVGRSASATASWTIVAAAVEASGTVGTPATLQVDGLTSDAGIAVDWGDGAGFVSTAGTASGNGFSFSHSYAADGSFGVRVRRAGTKVQAGLIAVSPAGGGDVTGPTVTIDAPVDGGIYRRHADVDVIITATDAESGVDAATLADEPTQADTSSFGEETLTVDVSDNAGNETIATSTYDVIIPLTQPFARVGNTASVYVFGLNDPAGISVDWGAGDGFEAVQPSAVSTHSSWMRIRHSYAEQGIFRPVVRRAGTVVSSSQVMVADPDRSRVKGNGKIFAAPGSAPGAPNASGNVEFDVDARWKYTNKHGWQTKGKFKLDLRQLGLGKFQSDGIATIVFIDDQAWYVGSGRLDGRRYYSYAVTVTDGNPDLLRMVIRRGNGALVFDNGTSSDPFDDPGTPISKGSLKITR